MGDRTVPGPARRALRDASRRLAPALSALALAVLAACGGQDSPASAPLEADDGSGSPRQAPSTVGPTMPASDAAGVDAAVPEDPARSQAQPGTEHVAAAGEPTPPQPADSGGTAPGGGPSVEAPAGDGSVAGSVFPGLRDDGRVARWTVEIVERAPHDPEAFTQGLELADGNMYESTGLWGRSSLRVVDMSTGESAASVELADEHFGEGLTVVGDQIIQLTWRSGIALVYDRSTLEGVAVYRYDGEGWGLCLLDDVLVMSDGSDRLSRRDPATFEMLGSVAVTAEGYDGRLDYLNELECVEGWVVANVWQTQRLLVIDPLTGEVAAVIDARPLLDDLLAALDQSEISEIDVLNGVAADDDGTLWMTGKLWPRLYRVRVVEAR